MAFTYGQLKAAIQEYTENTETQFVSNLPVFIRTAEERILKSVQLTIFRKNASAVTTVNDEFLACPSDFLAPFSLSLAGSNGDKEFVEFKDVTFIQSYTPDSTTTGTPKYYAQFDVDNFILGPTPDVEYTCELHYFYRPASITDTSVYTDASSTWLTTNAEMAMLYGSLIEAYIFMKGEPDVMQMYNSRFQEALIGVKMLGEARQTTDQDRTGQVIRQKQ
jgi:hypothetical protein